MDIRTLVAQDGGSTANRMEAFAEQMGAMAAPAGAELLYLAWGVLIGIAVAAPVGPVNIICLHRTLLSGPRTGVLVGAGAAVGDAIFGLIAALGFSFVQQMLDIAGPWVRVVGGSLMGFFAWRIWVSTARIHDETRAEDSAPPVKATLATFVLTITNPATLLGFFGLFSAIGFKQMGTDWGAPLRHALMVTGGVFTGSLLWWMALCYGVGLFRHRVDDGLLQMINRISAVIIGCFAIGAFISVLD